jgi:DNA-binding CsgD family transcriptional regulator
VAFREALDIHLRIENRFAIPFELIGIGQAVVQLPPAVDTGAGVATAIRLIGVADQIRESTGVEILPVEQAVREQFWMSTGRTPFDHRIQQLLTAGRGLPIGRALTLIDEFLALNGSESGARPIGPERRTSNAPVSLTRRELQVLRLLSQGFTNKRIAAELPVAEATVHAHLDHVRTKLSASTRGVNVWPWPGDAGCSSERFGRSVSPEIDYLVDADVELHL